MSKKVFYRIKEDHRATKEVPAENIEIRTFKLYQIEAMDEVEAERLWQDNKGVSIARLWTFYLTKGEEATIRLHINYYYSSNRKKNTAMRTSFILESDFFQGYRIQKPISEFRRLSED